MSRSVSSFTGTDKQLEIMSLVVDAAARGEALTIQGLLDNLSYKPSRSALHCSLGFLKRHGYLVTENHGRNGGIVKPTISGMTTFKPGPMNL